MTSFCLFVFIYVYLKTTVPSPSGLHGFIWKSTLVQNGISPKVLYYLPFCFQDFCFIVLFFRSLMWCDFSWISLQIFCFRFTHLLGYVCLYLTTNLRSYQPLFICTFLQSHSLSPFLQRIPWYDFIIVRQVREAVFILFSDFFSSLLNG